MASASLIVIRPDFELQALKQGEKEC